MRLAAIFVAMALVLVACGGDGDPGSFDADPGALDLDLRPALNDGEDPEAIPAVQRAWLERCARGDGDAVPAELAPVAQSGLLRVCGCSYHATVDHFRGEARADADTDASVDDIESEAYQRFRDLDDIGLDADLDAIETLFADCIRQEAFLAG